MRKIVWSLILIIVVGVIAFFQYKHFTPPSYTEMSLDEALVRYIERFDDDYLSQPEKDDLKSLVNNSLFVGLEYGGSRLSGSIPDEYGLYLNASLFDADNLDPGIAAQSLAENPDNFMLILTLIHENQHRVDSEVMDSSLLFKHEEETVKSFTLATLFEYFGYKKEFVVLTRWNERYDFPLPKCKIYDGGAWLNINAEEMTAEQYGFGMAMHYFLNGMAPHADEFLPDTRNVRMTFRNTVRKTVLSEVKRSTGELQQYGKGLLEGMLQCPDGGFPNK